MGALAGPSPISRNGQVTVPKYILEQLDWQQGDLLMFRISEEDPETLSLVPAGIAERRYQRGERAERLANMTGDAKRSSTGSSEPSNL